MQNKIKTNNVLTKILILNCCFGMNPGAQQPNAQLAPQVAHRNEQAAELLPWFGPDRRLPLPLAYQTCQSAILILCLILVNHQGFKDRYPEEAWHLSIYFAALLMANRFYTFGRNAAFNIVYVLLFGVAKNKVNEFLQNYIENSSENPDEYANIPNTANYSIEEL